MTENEQISRWLWPDRYRKSQFNAEVTIDADGTPAVFPDFRTSNEWAGAVLEKLGKRYVKLRSPEPDCPYWECEMGRIWARGDDWRSAVVDAALEVIKRSGSASGSQE